MRMERMKIPPYEPKIPSPKTEDGLPDLPSILQDQKQEVLDRIQERKKAKEAAKKEEQKAKEEGEEEKKAEDAVAEEKKEEEAKKPPLALTNLFDILVTGDDMATLDTSD